MNNSNSGLTKEKAQVYKLMFDIIAKFFLVIIGVGAFITVLVFFLCEKDSVNKGILGVVDALLSPSIFTVFQHYFPSKK